MNLKKKLETAKNKIKDNKELILDGILITEALAGVGLAAFFLGKLAEEKKAHAKTLSFAEWVAAWAKSDNAAPKILKYDGDGHYTISNMTDTEDE